MSDYKKMYLKLFNETTNAIELLEKAQQNAEAMFIEAVEAETAVPAGGRENDPSR